jgi:hypothetical protein
MKQVNLITKGYKKEREKDSGTTHISLLWKCKQQSDRGVHCELKLM